MGIFPDDKQLRLGAVDDYQTDMASMKKLLQFSLQNFQPQRQFLGEQREAASG